MLTKFVLIDSNQQSLRRFLFQNLEN